MPMDVELEITQLKARMNAVEGQVTGLRESFNSHKDQDVHDSVLEDYNAVCVKSLEKTGKKIWDAWQEAWEKEPFPPNP